MVEFPQRSLGVAEFDLCLGNGMSQLVEGHVGCDLGGAALVLLRAKVLDFLARVFYFCQAQGSTGALEEVAQGGELVEIFLFAEK